MLARILCIEGKDCKCLRIFITSIKHMQVRVFVVVYVLYFLHVRVVAAIDTLSREMNLKSCLVACR